MSEDGPAEKNSVWMGVMGSGSSREGEDDVILIIKPFPLVDFPFYAIQDGFDISFLIKDHVWFEFSPLLIFLRYRYSKKKKIAKTI